MSDTRTDEERHADFIELYRKSGGSLGGGERLWIRSELQRNAPKLQAENVELRDELATMRQRAEAAEARADRAEATLREVENHHIELNGKIGRPLNRSRTLGIARAARAMTKLHFAPDGSLSISSIEQWIDALGQDWRSPVFAQIVYLIRDGSDSQAMAIFDCAISKAVNTQPPREDASWTDPR